MSSAASAARVTGLWLTVRAAQGEALFVSYAGLHMVFFSHFFSFMFSAAGIWLNGL